MSLTFGDGATLSFNSKDDLVQFIKSSSEVASTEYSMDVFWLIICAGLVFLMQAGFALVEVGSVRMKNTKNILLKNMLDATIGATVWWLFGFGMAYGTDDGNGVVGTRARDAGDAP